MPQRRLGPLTIRRSDNGRRLLILWPGRWAVMFADIRRPDGLTEHEEGP